MTATVPHPQEATVTPQVDVMDISPDVAEAMLGRNVHNRNLRWSAVNALAADMQADEWRWNGETIKLAADGTVLDGQHRLHAIRESGRTLPMLVVTGLPREAQDSVDTGTRRSFADVLKMRGEANCHSLAAVLRRAYLWTRGRPRASTTREIATNAQMTALYERHPELRDAADNGGRVNRAVPLATSTASLCWWLFHSIDSDDADYFFERLIDGAELTPRHPVHVLRKTLQDAERGKSALKTDVATAYVIKAWNAFREGREIGLLRWRPGGAKPEAFPVPL